VARQLKTLLNGNQELHPLLTRVQALSDLQTHFTAVAPPHLAQSVQILSLKLGRLSVAAANAANAAKLRQLAPELVTLMQNRGCEVSGIVVKVQVSYDRRQPPPDKRQLSKTAQHELLELSRRLDDSPLKLALDRIAGKTKI
jgi:hypothetical protein